MRALRLVVVIGLCFGFTPGLSELVGDATHLIADGHTHHADGHEEPGTEHGCTGWQHTCGCCMSLSVAPSVHIVPALLAAWRDLRLPAPRLARGPAGVRHGVDRPPRS